MKNQKHVSVIIDTNVCIGFLIGKELHGLKYLIINNQIKIIVTDQLLAEIQLVTSRKKLSRYFDEKKVSELLLYCGLFRLTYP